MTFANNLPIFCRLLPSKNLALSKGKLFAHVCQAEAVVFRERAAVIAFPIDMIFTMLFIISIACSIGQDLAVFAEEALFFGVLFHATLLLAVNHAAKVGLLAIAALVKSARVEGQVEQFALKVVSWGVQSFSIRQALIVSHLESQCLYRLTQLRQRG